MIRRVLTRIGRGFVLAVFVSGILAAVAFSSTTATASRAAKTRIAGFAFVDSSVTAQGTRARLPRGTRIYRSGSTITGTTGCPTNRYQTNGLLVLVIDYSGPKTAGSVTVTRRLAGSGQGFTGAPYYLDLNPGREIQFLGPIFQNGNYNVAFQYGFVGRNRTTLSAKITLSRHCPNNG